MDPPGDSSIVSGQTLFDSGVIGVNKDPRPVMSELVLCEHNSSELQFRDCGTPLRPSALTGKIHCIL